MSLHVITSRLSRLQAARRHPSGGFTLVEVMLSMVLVAIVLVPLSGLFTYGLSASTFAAEQTEAKLLAQQKFEELKNRPYYIIGPDPVAGPVDLMAKYYRNDTVASPTGYRISPPAYVTQETSGKYTLTTTLTAVKNDTTTPITPPAGYDSQSLTLDAPPSSLMKVEVRIDWTTPFGGAQSYTTTSLISQSY